jgi:hypothetical protein
VERDAGGEQTDETDPARLGLSTRAQKELIRRRKDTPIGRSKPTACIVRNAAITATVSAPVTDPAPVVPTPFAVSFADDADDSDELDAAPKPGPQNWPNTGNGVIRRLGNGPLHGPIRGGRAILIPIGEHDFPDGTRVGPAGRTSAGGEHARAGETTVSETCSLHTETKLDLPETSAGGLGDPHSQKRETGVGKPISFQNSWTRSSLDFLILIPDADSSAPSTSTRMAASLATAAGPSSSLDSSSDPRQLNRDPESPHSGEIRCGEGRGVGASVKRRRRDSFMALSAFICHDSQEPFT